MELKSFLRSLYNIESSDLNPVFMMANKEASSPYCPIVPSCFPNFDTIVRQIAAVERRQDDVERHFAETNLRMIHYFKRLHDGQCSLGNQSVSNEASVRNSVDKNTIGICAKPENVSSQLEQTLMRRSEYYEKERANNASALSEELKTVNAMLERILNMNNKQESGQLDTLLKEKEATKKQLAEFTVEIEKLKGENSELREKTQEQSIKLQSEKEDFTSTLEQNKETLEKQTKELQLAKADLAKLQSENNVIKDNLLKQQESAEAAEKKLQHTVNQKDKLLLEIVELKSENENLKNPQDWSLNFWRNKIHDNISRRQSMKENYTICVAYSSDLAPGDLASAKIEVLLKNELQPVTRSGAKFKFVYHIIDGFVIKPQKPWDAVIVVNKLTSNRLGEVDREVYDLLNAHYGGGNGRVDRRHVVNILAAQPTIENIVPFDDIDEIRGISKDLLITQNMSTLFISNKEKNLVCCEMNKAMIREITKWIMDVITSP